MSKPFNLEITFKDLCAFVPHQRNGNPEGVFLFPEVRRPKNWRKGEREVGGDDDPFHAHMPAVIFPKDALVEGHDLQRLVYLEQQGTQRKSEEGQLVWFPSEADVIIETGKQEKARQFKDVIQREKVCDFDWIYAGQKKPQLDPLLLKAQQELTEQELKVLMRKLNLRVWLDDGELIHNTPELDHEWYFQVPGETDDESHARPLAESMSLTLTGLHKVVLRGHSFMQGQESVELKPAAAGETLRITMMNMTVEMFLGLNFGDTDFWEKEKDRAKHFKLFFALAQDWPHARKIPHRRKQSPETIPMPPEELFCPPLYFPS